MYVHMMNLRFQHYVSALRGAETKYGNAMKVNIQPLQYLHVYTVHIVTTYFS